MTHIYTATGENTFKFGHGLETKISLEKEKLS